MKKFLTRATDLNAADLIVVLFCSLLSLINIAFYFKIETWYLNVLMNCMIITFVFFVSSRSNESEKIFYRQIHYWYFVPLIFLFFKEIYLMVDPVRGITIDDYLIKIDRFIFGFDPTIELYKISSPVLTELLQIVYGTFFFLPVILGVDLILGDKTNEFKYSTFIIVYGFVLSFIGYILFPAIGPRFTLHNFEMNNIEMPGLFITDVLREIVNSGESIPTGTPNPASIVQRDAFPSGHTQMTLLVMYLSVRFKSKLKYFFLINGTLLIFATLYLRYHYVADLIGGFIFMVLTLWSGKQFYSWWNEKQKRNQRL